MRVFFIGISIFMYCGIVNVLLDFLIRGGDTFETIVVLLNLFIFIVLGVIFVNFLRKI